MPRVANRLKNVQIDFISLVPAGANRRTFVARSVQLTDGDGRSPVTLDDKVLKARIHKVDEEKREVTGVIYPVGEVDTQGDFMTEPDLDAAMHLFQKRGRAAKGVAGDINHDEVPTDDYFPEVYKIAQGDSRWEEKDWGAWVVTRKVESDEHWEAIQSGELNAFSFGGWADVYPDQQVTRRLILRDAIRVIEHKSIQEIADYNEIRRRVEDIIAALWEAYWGAPPEKEEEQAAVAEVLREAMDYISKKKGQKAQKTEKGAGLMQITLKRLEAIVKAVAQKVGVKVDGDNPDEHERITAAVKEVLEKEGHTLVDDEGKPDNTDLAELVKSMLAEDPAAEPEPEPEPVDKGGDPGGSRLPVNRAPGRNSNVFKGVFARIEGWNSPEAPTVEQYLNARAKGLISPTTASTMNGAVLRQWIADVENVMPFLSKITTRIISEPDVRIPDFTVSPRRSRAVVPGSDPATITGNVTASQRTAAPKKLMTPYDFEEDFFEENVMGENAETYIRGLLVNQWALDNVDLMFAGDESISAAAEVDEDNFLRMNDGFFTIAEADSGVNDYDHEGSSEYLDVVFGEMLKKMPKKYRGREDLAYLVSQDVYDEYVDQIIEGRVTAVGDSFLIGDRAPTYKGKPLIVPSSQYGVDWATLATQKIMLTPLANLCFFVWYELRYNVQGDFRKDQIEHTLKAKTDYNYAKSDAIVLCEDFA